MANVGITESLVIEGIPFYKGKVPGGLERKRRYIVLKPLSSGSREEAYQLALKDIALQAKQEGVVAVRNPRIENDSAQPKLTIRVLAEGYR